MSLDYTLFDTPLGTCAIAWSERGIAGLQLPEPTPDETSARLFERTGEATRAEAPRWVAEAIRLLTRHLEGKPQALTGIRLDLGALPPFHRKVCEVARAVEPGKTITYGELAALAGSPGAARAVGQVMATNRFPIVVPCHRVVAAGGRPGGFSAAGGLKTKERLLALEGVALRPQRSLFSGEGALPFDPRKAVRHLVKADRQLARVIEAVGPLRLKPESMNRPYESLAEAIVYQQLTGKAAATILGRVKALFDDRFPAPRELLEIAEETLRAAGLSRPKVAALRDLAAKTIEGQVPGLEQLAAMTDEEIVERLCAVRGIGRWTVEMLLIFRLGRPDVLPVSDYGIRKGFSRMVGLQEPAAPAEIARHGERWRPFRTAASWYLWRAAEQDFS
ncbi:MAG: methylated-DNA--[protein]-cysteine S-methyltransferase [Myxococcales bacterium]|jgi:O-6-methylguanine DNA methyltransferase